MQYRRLSGNREAAAAVLKLGISWGISGYHLSLEYSSFRSTSLATNIGEGVKRKLTIGHSELLTKNIKY